MTGTLSKRALASNRAEVKDCLRACGAQLWPRAALRQYQHEQEHRALNAHIAEFRAWMVSYKALFEILALAAMTGFVACEDSMSAAGAISGWYLCARIIGDLARWPSWQTNELLHGDLYWRDGSKRALPEPAQKVVDGARMFFDDAKFAVSFVGHDPVLHVFVNGRSYHALVWDVNADGSIEVVAPPVE